MLLVVAGFLDVKEWSRTRIWTAHKSIVRDCVYSRTGDTIVSCSDDRTLRTWDATTKALKHSLVGHSHNVVSVVVSPDGRSILSASWDKTLKVNHSFAVFGFFGTMPAM